MRKYSWYAKIWPMDQFLLVSELQHFLLSLSIALIFYWRYRDWRVIPFCFLFGFFVDIDHFLDCFAYRGLDFNLWHFLDVSTYVKPGGRVYILFHGFEYFLPFWLVGRWLGQRWQVKKLEWAICLAYLGHLLLDHFSFSHHPLMYFFIYRLVNGFSLEAVMGI